MMPQIRIYSSPWILEAEARAPQALCKYFKLDASHHERLFTHNEIYFPSPLDFNDPFDCRIIPSFEATAQEHRRRLASMLQMEKGLKTSAARKQAKALLATQRHRDPQWQSEVIQRALESRRRMGVCCFSEDRSNLLLWSHYGDSHRGFCLEFKHGPNVPFLGLALPVRYSDTYPEINFVRDPQDEVLRATLLTKSSEWAYEKEWRLIDFDRCPGVRRFPPDLLTGVIFGAAMSTDHIALIKDWLSKGHCRPRLIQARLKKRSFGLDFDDIEASCSSGA